MDMISSLYDLIKTAFEEARKKKQTELAEKILDIEIKVKELADENERLHKELDIVNNMIYDNNGESFTLPNNPNIHYCSVCYGHSKKLIPMVLSNTEEGKYLCRICNEIWFDKSSNR